MKKPYHFSALLLFSQVALGLIPSLRLSIKADPKGRERPDRHYQLDQSHHVLVQHVDSSLILNRPNLLLVMRTSSVRSFSMDRRM